MTKSQPENEILTSFPTFAFCPIVTPVVRYQFLQKYLPWFPLPQIMFSIALRLWFCVCFSFCWPFSFGWSPGFRRKKIQPKERGSQGDWRTWSCGPGWVGFQRIFPETAFMFWFLNFRHWTCSCGRWNHGMWGHHTHALSVVLLCALPCLCILPS